MTIRDRKTVDKKIVKSIAEKYSCDLLTAFILVNRGITDTEIPYFLSDDIGLLRDPLLLPDIQKAIDRIIQAVRNHEKIIIFGDRDVDGITATVMLIDFLQSLNSDVDWRVPVGNEPYGLSTKAVEEFSAIGGNLIITVDCGISNVIETVRATELGIDVIITDHHLPKETLPPAIAIVNTKVPHSLYDFHDICGCMVVFKILIALQQTLDMNGTGVKDFKHKELEYLQLATLATIADIVPLRDENRLFVRKGLAALMKSPRYGITELLVILGLSGKPITTEKLSWILCPAINASGRMGCPDKAVALLLEKDPKNRIILAREIKSLNDKRKRIGTKTWPLAEQLAAESLARFGGKLVIAADESINRGITGIMANRLMEKYHIPAMVVYLGNDLAIGSIRSPGNYDIRLLLEPLDDIILNYGGHKDALGFSMERSSWEQYVDRLEIEMETIHLKEKPADDSLIIDAELPHRYIAPDILNLVDRFEPYGEGNNELLFVSKKLKMAESTLLGKRQPKHVKFILDTGNYKWPAILWNNISKADEIHAGDLVDIIYTVSRNWYNGLQIPQIILQEISKSDTEQEKLYN
jgi:single-stranded-DNA-specific exonuclease RecJ